jgi:hypothetical protein
MAHGEDANQRSSVPGRALVAVGPSEPAIRMSAGPRPSAVFLAQLIAHRQQAPQTRMRRRAEPDAALATYAAGSQRHAPLAPRLSVRA